ncbi:hypothetical protein SLE2022_287470 [Rubroshorea leprosula]
MVELHGGHMVSHERTEEVNQALLDLIKASEKKINPQDWTNFPKRSSESMTTRMSFGEITDGERTVFIEKLYVCLLHLFSLLVIALKYGRRALQSVKPVRIGPTLT